MVALWRQREFKIYPPTPPHPNRTSSATGISQRKRKRKQKAVRIGHLRQTTLIQEVNLFAMWDDPYILKEDETYRLGLGLGLLSGIKCLRKRETSFGSCL